MFDIAEQLDQEFINELLLQKDDSFGKIMVIYLIAGMGDQIPYYN